VSLVEAWAKGGEGTTELANMVIEYIAQDSSNFKQLYDINLPLKDKIEIIAKNMYGASGVEYSANAKKMIAKVESMGLGNLAICMAKTQKSLSDNQSLKNRPTGFVVNIREVELSSGAGFIVPIAGAIMRMPGLPATPAAENIDIDKDGNITGLF